MKKLLILPLLVFLTGCVSYYYPETALEDGVYYAEDDPSYVVYSGGYGGVAYYPWYSLDYFYLGYYPYAGYSIGYGYPSGFSFGFSYAFSPWYYPSHYHGYYSPWYSSYYHHHRYAYHPAWQPYRGYYSGHRGDRYKKHRRDDWRDRYARNGRYDRRDRTHEKSRPEDDASDKRRQEQPDPNHSSSVRRYVSTAPGGQSGNRGVEIRNRESTKVGKSRLHVDRPTSTASTMTKSTRAPSPPKASTSSRSKASASSKQSSRTAYSSSKKESSRRQNRR